MRFAPLLLVGLTLLGGCGYSLEMSRDTDAPLPPDPITVLGRDLRQLKADHRVSLFDLKNEQKALAEETRAELKKRLEQLELQIQTELRNAREQRQTALGSLRRRDADFDEQIAEMELQLRLMGGSIDEEINRYKDASEQTNNNALRELGNLKRLLAKNAEEKSASIKALRERIAEEQDQREAMEKAFDGVVLAQAKEEEQARVSLQHQIKQIESSGKETSASSDEQIKALNQVSVQVDQLIEKLLPAVNLLAERLDKQEDQFDALKREIDIEALKQQLKALSDTVDIQRQSLEMLGSTLTSEVDKQKGLLQKTVEGLQAIEPEVSGKK